MFRIGCPAIILILLLTVLGGPFVSGQTAAPARVLLGSQTAKNGFRNEDEIARKFNDWQTDPQAEIWLRSMGHKPAEILAVSATKPHGEKADILVRVRTNSGETTEGISIKLVSGPQGFNQIDKRWLRQYAAKWKMPSEVETSLRLFTGEVKPDRPSRNPDRMFLNELSAGQQRTIVEFFTAKKAEIISDLLAGDGARSAGWMLVALRTSEKPRWVLRRIEHAVKFFSEGPVTITRQGNLKIGRVTMQRKGGDGGRETAKMLQFKVNPALLFEHNGF